MLDFVKAIPVIIIGGILVYLVINVGQPPPDKGTQKALEPTKTTHNGIRHHDNKPEADIVVTHKPSGDKWGLSLYADGVPYQEREQIADDKFQYEYTRHRYGIDIDLDLGVWTGFRSSGDSKDSAIDIGLRYSPVRLAWGYIAPDLLLSPNAGGIGVSFYIPDAPGFWKHVGVGIAWMDDFHSHTTSFMPYAALSIRF
jgi:hypothetical protein